MASLAPPGLLFYRNARPCLTSSTWCRTPLIARGARRGHHLPPRAGVDALSNLIRCGALLPSGAHVRPQREHPMRLLSFDVLIGSLVLGAAPAIAQTTAPGSAAPATSGGGM